MEQTVKDLRFLASGMASGSVKNTVLNAAAEIERLGSALQRYGMHTWECAYNDSKGELPCDCGWDALSKVGHQP